MNKSTIVFQQVAAVIGKDLAEYNLQLVAKNTRNFHMDACNLNAAFLFCDTPQDKVFWLDIANHENSRKVLGEFYDR